MENKKLSLGRCAILVLALSLGEYLLEHILYMITDAAITGAISISADALTLLGSLFSYITEWVEIFVLAASMLMALISLTTSGRGRCAACIGIAVASRLIYLVPHYYMTILTYGYDSIETLVTLIPVCLFISALFYVEVSLAVILGTLPAWHRSRKCGETYRDLISSDLERRDALDLSNLSTAAVALMTLTAAIKPLAAAIINTVTVLVDRGGMLSPAIFIGMIFDYVFIIFAYALIHLILSALKHRLPQPTEDDNRDNKEEAKADMEEKI